MPNRFALFSAVFAASILTAVLSFAQTNLPMAEYKIYAGNTHSHTVTRGRTASSSPRGDCAGIMVFGPMPSPPGLTLVGWLCEEKNDCPGIYVINSAQIPAPGMTVKPDWQKFQGPPSEHFRSPRNTATTSTP